jgi:hypothetical protein
MDDEEKVLAGRPDANTWLPHAIGYTDGRAVEGARGVEAKEGVRCPCQPTGRLSRDLCRFQVPVSGPHGFSRLRGTFSARMLSSHSGWPASRRSSVLSRVVVGFGIFKVLGFVGTPFAGRNRQRQPTRLQYCAASLQA